MKNKIEKTTNWFLIKDLCNFIYFPIVHYFLNNPNLGERFKNVSFTLYASQIYLLIGVIWLIFGIVYLISDYAHYFKFTRRSKQLHFYLTIVFIFCLMMVPILDTYYPTSDVNRNSLFSQVFGYVLPISVLAFIAGTLLFFINLIRAVLNLILKNEAI
jgi:uncharacterized membrane protein YagU involved in acid resistance